MADTPEFDPSPVALRIDAPLEQTDAVVIMASEESGEISIAHEGRFIPVVNRERLINILKDFLVPENKKKK